MKCSRCQEDKPLDLFHKNKKNKNGYDTCKACHSSNTKKYQKADPRKLDKKNKDWYTRNASKIRDRRYKKVYGISEQQYNEMLVKQNYCCKLCGAHKDNFSYALNVDHCHKTGKIRGLLCGPCNTAIGRFGDDVAGVERVLKYLKGELNEQTPDNETSSCRETEQRT